MANFGIQIGSGGIFIQDRPLAGLHDDLLHEVELKEPEITFQDMFREVEG